MKEIVKLLTGLQTKPTFVGRRFEEFEDSTEPLPNDLEVYAKESVKEFYDGAEKLEELEELLRSASVSSKRKRAEQKARQFVAGNQVKPFVGVPDYLRRKWTAAMIVFEVRPRM